MDKQQGQKLLAAGAALAIAEPALAHFSGPGVIVGLAAAGAAYVAVGAFQKPKQTSEEIESIREKEKPGTSEGHSLGYRLFNGKSTREEGQEPARRLEFAGQDDLAPPSQQKSGAFLFSDVLHSFRPTLEKIYLGTINGKHIFVRAEDLCHVALAGATRGGKSSIMRMLIAQLCYAGASVLLLNPHHSRYILDKQEDWTPFEPYLMYDPMECRKYEIIEHYLRQLAQEKLPARLDRYAHSLPTGKPYFVVLDELPAIMRHVPQAGEYLTSILQEGAKVGIFLITAAQDFLVKTLFPNGGSGAVRDCYRTVLYVGGDGTTAKVLLDMPAAQVPETSLGKGTVMLRCDSVRPAALARVPLVDNGALYGLLGPSTYDPDQTEEKHTDSLPSVPTTPPQTRRYATSSYDASRAYREQKRARVPVYAAQKKAEPITEDLPTQKDDLLERALAAYDDGSKTVNALALALEMTPWTVRPIYTQVKALRK